MADIKKNNVLVTTAKKSGTNFCFTERKNVNVYQGYVYNNGQGILYNQTGINFKVTHFYFDLNPAQDLPAWGTFDSGFWGRDQYADITSPSYRIPSGGSVSIYTTQVQNVRTTHFVKSTV